MLTADNARKIAKSAEYESKYLFVDEQIQMAAKQNKTSIIIGENNVPCYLVPALRDDGFDVKLSYVIDGSNPLYSYKISWD